jgi:HlyD family secretion protein
MTGSPLTPLTPLTLLLLALVPALACRPADSGALRATGTVEVREVDVSPLVPARVVRVLVDEGQTVRAGDTLVTLIQSTTHADLASAEARLGAAEAALSEARAGARRRELQRAAADLRVAEAEAARAAADLTRMQALVEHGTVSRQAFDAARAAAAATAGRRDGAQDALQLLREGTRPERLRALEAEVASARAALAGTRSVAADLVLAAPVTGIVMSRNAEPGERLAPGQSALTIGQTAEPWVRVYLPTRALPTVREGQPAVARLDGFPSHPIAGRVVAISPKAEFTPRIALTEDERADLLFGVKVALSDTTGLLRPGLPATVELEAGRR